MAVPGACDVAPSDVEAGSADGGGGRGGGLPDQHGGGGADGWRPLDCPSPPPRDRATRRMGPRRDLGAGVVRRCRRPASAPAQAPPGPAGGGRGVVAAPEAASARGRQRSRYSGAVEGPSSLSRGGTRSWVWERKRLSLFLDFGSAQPLPSRPMTSAPVSRRHLEGLLRAGRSAVVLVALLGLLALTSVPHHHSSPSEERSCPACQVIRHGGGNPPEAPAADILRPEGPPVPIQLASLEVADLHTHAGPLPTRGPPPVPPAEQL